ncbi:MAG: ribosome biogenesis GTPase YlqF [Desulfotomaculales bacterium]
MPRSAYPGHMAAARRALREHLSLVDVVLEVLDARVPASSRNPDLARLLGNKDRVLVLNKEDLADPDLTAVWLGILRREGWPVLAVSAATGAGVASITEACAQLAAARPARRWRKSLRLMVAGMPNVGKSRLINVLVGRRAARTGKAPGVTRGRQWLRLAEGMELLDLPGVLYPGLKNPGVLWRLAAVGILESEENETEVAEHLLRRLGTWYPAYVAARYGGADSVTDLGEVARRRGFLLPGGAPDLRRAASHVLKDFREGKLGRCTLDRP